MKRLAWSSTSLWLVVVNNFIVHIINTYLTISFRSIHLTTNRSSSPMRTFAPKFWILSYVASIRSRTSKCSHFWRIPLRFRFPTLCFFNPFWILWVNVSIESLGYYWFVQIMSSKEIKLRLDVGTRDDEDGDEPPAAVVVFHLFALPLCSDALSCC